MAVAKLELVRPLENIGPRVVRSVPGAMLDFSNDNDKNRVAIQMILTKSIWGRQYWASLARG